MGVREELTEPWGIVAAGVLGGLGGAVTAALAPAAMLGLPVGLAIAGVVYGVKVATGALVGRSAPPPRFPALPTPRRGSPADRWLRRAAAAVDALRRQEGSVPDRTLRAQVDDVDESAGAVLADLTRLAGQVTVVEDQAGGIDVARLRAERRAIAGGLHRLPTGPLRAERERALRALDDQLAVAGRLAEAHETLLARMQSTVLGLEGLVARMAELLALHASTDSGSLTAGRVAELTADLEGLRAGLAEAERISRGVLGDN